MSVYLLLQNLHIVIALASGIGFGLRGYVRLVMKRPLAHPMMRFGPHVLDTVLLASGVALWILTGMSLWSWFGLKLLLVVVYVALGIAAFRAAAPARGVVLYVAALLAFVAVAVVSVTRPALA